MPDVVAKKKKEQPEHIDNTELVLGFRAEGGNILHVRPSHGTLGMTFAYKKKGNRMEVSTSLQHPSDAFTKKLGTKTAIEHFHAGKTIFLPVRGVFGPLGVLSELAAVTLG